MTEFSVLFDLQSVNDVAQKHMSIAADAQEREALARRFDLPVLAKLEADLEISQTKSATRFFQIKGFIKAEYQQICVRSGQPCDQHMAQNFSLRFHYDPLFREDHEGVNVHTIDLEEAEVIASSLVDIGELVAEQFYLFRDPYPYKDSDRE